MVLQQNRAIALWQSWQEKEKMLLDVFGHNQIPGGLEREKYEFLSAGLQRLSPTGSPDEKLVMGLIQKSVKRLERQLYPRPLLRLAHRIKRLVFDLPIAGMKMAMLKKANIAALDAAIGKLGIDTLRLNLGKALDFENQSMDFRLSSPLGVDKRFEILLHLEKDYSGKFQFQGYTGKLDDLSETSANRSCRFDAGMEISSREALNLLQGRAVLKGFDDTAREKNWLQLEFDPSSGAGAVKEFGGRNGFELKAEMEKIAESLKQPELNQGYILNALARGNQVVVKRLTGEKLFLEAAPLSSKVVVRDAGQKVVPLEKLLKKKEKSLGLNTELKITRSRQKQQGQALGIA